MRRENVIAALHRKHVRHVKSPAPPNFSCNPTSFTSHPVPRGGRFALRLKAAIAAPVWGRRVISKVHVRACQPRQQTAIAHACNRINGCVIDFGPGIPASGTVARRAVRCGRAASLRAVGRRATAEFSCTSINNCNPDHRLSYECQRAHVVTRRRSRSRTETLVRPTAALSPPPQPRVRVCSMLWLPIVTAESSVS